MNWWYLIPVLFSVLCVALAVYGGAYARSERSMNVSNALLKTVMALGLLGVFAGIVIAALAAINSMKPLADFVWLTWPFALAVMLASIVAFIAVAIGDSMLDRRRHPATHRLVLVPRTTSPRTEGEEA